MGMEMGMKGRGVRMMRRRGGTGRETERVGAMKNMMREIEMVEEGGGRGERAKEVGVVVDPRQSQKKANERMI